MLNLNFLILKKLLIHINTSRHTLVLKMAEKYSKDLNESINESKKLQASFVLRVPGVGVDRVVRIDELTFAIDLGKKSFMCRCPMSNGINEEFYEVHIVVHEPRQVETLVLKFHTTKEIFDLFRKMVNE